MTSFVASERSKTACIARFDAERIEADRLAGRGYDFDCSAPSHPDFLDRTGQRCSCQASSAEQQEREIERLARSDGWIPPSPAQAIVTTCWRHGVALSIAPDGTLVVGKTGAKADEPSQAWPTLIRAIEAHLEAVAELVAAGWNLRADFPERGAA